MGDLDDLCKQGHKHNVAVMGEIRAYKRLHHPPGPSVDPETSRREHAVAQPSDLSPQEVRCGPRRGEGGVAHQGGAHRPQPHALRQLRLRRGGAVLQLVLQRRPGDRVPASTQATAPGFVLRIRVLGLLAGIPQLAAQPDQRRHHQGYLQVPREYGAKVPQEGALAEGPGAPEQEHHCLPDEPAEEEVRRPADRAAVQGVRQ